MKKITMLLLSVIIISCLSACNSNNKNNNEDTNQEVTTIPTDNTTPQITEAPEITQAPAVTDIPEEGASPFEPVFTERTAIEFVNDMGIGWNLGNTLDSHNAYFIGPDTLYEIAWGNVMTTKELIQFVKSEGFDTIRIPVTWDNHLGEAPDYKIGKMWLDRVQEIVNWCIEEDMYVIINMHHDDWIKDASKDYDAVMEKYKAIWSQLADRFGDYPENLIYESMNEVGFDSLGTEKGAALVEKINGEFVELIRSSGKHNDKRFLLLAGYWTDIDRTVGRITNQGDDRAIISVHYYSPSTFTIADVNTSWGYQETWGTEEDYAYLQGQMDKLKTAYLDLGVPVIIGEFGSVIKDKDKQSRLDYLSSVVKYARAYGMCPVLWDNGQEISRTLLTWNTEGLAEAIRDANK